MDNYKTLQLHGQIGKNLTVLIDSEDYERVSKFKWYPVENGSGQIYAYTKIIDNDTKRRKTILLHRFIMCPSINKLIDHKNHKTLDNRKSNLRICNTSQNNANGKKHKDNTHGFKGISLFKNKKKELVYWRARIRFNKKEYVTYHKEKIDAIKSYNSMAEKFYGEFAYKIAN